MNPIFLDFLCPDAWKTYATIPKYLDDATTQSLVTLLKSSINYSVLLSEGFCILPPAFILQSDIVYAAIQDQREYLDYKEILLPLKETSIDEYISKKMREYQYVKKNYKGFFQREVAESFLDKYRYSIMQRTSSMGASIAASWLILSDDSRIWKPILNSAPKIADTIRYTPSYLNSKGISITLEAILKSNKIIPTDAIKFAVNQAIQYEYINGYLKEYDAKIIANIPPKPYLFNFAIIVESKYYDYSFLMRVLRKAGGEKLIHLLSNAPPNYIYEIKNSADFLYVRREYYKYCLNSGDDIYSIIESAQSYIHREQIGTVKEFIDFIKCVADKINSKSVSFNRFRRGVSKMTSKKKTVFISYKSEDQCIADIIYDTIKAKTGSSLIISRYTELKYKDSFSEFMNSIEDHDYVISIVSDNYLKSIPCMYEVGEIIKTHHFKDRLFHVVLGEEDRKYYSNPTKFAPADVFSPESRLMYVQYWDNYYNKFHKLLEGITDYEARQASTQTLSKIGRILRNDIQLFTEYVADHNAGRFIDLYIDEFNDIISAMNI